MYLHKETDIYTPSLTNNSCSYRSIWKYYTPPNNLFSQTKVLMQILLLHATISNEPPCLQSMFSSSEFLYLWHGGGGCRVKGLSSDCHTALCEDHFLFEGSGSCSLHVPVMQSWGRLVSRTFTNSPHLHERVEVLTAPACHLRAHLDWVAFSQGAQEATTFKRPSRMRCS